MDNAGFSTSTVVRCQIESPRLKDTHSGFGNRIGLVMETLFVMSSNFYPQAATIKQQRCLNASEFDGVLGSGAQVYRSRAISIMRSP